MFSRERKTPLAEWWWTVDRGLLGAFLLLLGVGVVLSFAASPAVAEAHDWGTWYFVIRQIAFAVLGGMLMIAVSVLPHRLIRVLAIAMLAGSLVLLLATLQFGEEIKGARRWLSLFGYSFQPSEAVKPAFAVVAAWLFSEWMVRRDMPGWQIATVLLAVIVAMLLRQPDVGQTALVVFTWGVLLFLSGISWWVIFGLAAIGLGGAYGAYLFFPHVTERIDAFLNQADSGVYQVEKAIGSILEGGWLGRGPGEAITKRYLPDAHADYVFSAAAGEFGILFCLLLVALIGFVALRSLRGAVQQNDLFARMAVAALASQFGMQSAINLMVNVNLIPPKGMTLPFVSYGGTSMLAVAVGMGMMLGLMRKRPEEQIATGLPAYRSALGQPT
ncbi:MAG: putative lipid II flippase FtsW [Alphaproteobacteria bacterium]|nr:putative lipid II flippase FtsW [Alphaproteobacteria bacterium]